MSGFLPAAARNLAFAAWDNESEGWLALGNAPEARGVYRVERRDGVICAWWQGEPGRAANQLRVGRVDAADPCQALDALFPEIAASPSACDLRLPPGGGADAWVQAAHALGFGIRGTDVLMACDFGTVRPLWKIPAEVTVQAADSEEEHRAAVALVRSVCQEPPGLTEFFLARGRVRVYLGRWRGEPAASAALWPFAGAAGIHCVAALPEFQKHGLVTAVLQTLLDDAQTQGFRAAVLHADENLIRFYQRSGFQAVGRSARLRRSNR